MRGGEPGQRPRVVPAQRTLEHRVGGEPPCLDGRRVQARRIRRDDAAEARVEGGVGELQLSPEEQEAVDLALEGAAPLPRDGRQPRATAPEDGA